MTSRQLQALEIIRSNPGITAKQFAHFFWPDHDGQYKHSNNGSNGSTLGKTMWLMGGGYLGKLRNKGLVRNGLLALREKDNGFYVKDCTNERVHNADLK